MKKLIIIPAMAALMAMPAQALFVTIGNDFSAAFIDNSGTPLVDGTGFVAAGVLSNSGSVTVSNLAANFTAFSGSTLTAGAGGFDGFIAGALQAGRQAGGSQFLNADLFIVVGNGADLASSTQLAVLATGEQISDDSAAVEASITYQPTATTDIHNGIGVSTTAVILATNIDSVQLVPVPEPSTSLLALAGLAGFALRRRR